MNGKPTDHYSDEQLSAYVEGELEDSSARDVEDHLAGCDRCHAAVQQIKNTRGLLASLPREAAPDLFSARVKSRIRRRSRGRFFTESSPTGYRLTLLVAAIILMLLAALYFFSQIGPQLRDGTTGLTGDELRQHLTDPEQPDVGRAP